MNKSRATTAELRQARQEADGDGLLPAPERDNALIMRDSAPIAAPMVNATIGIERVLEIAAEKGMGPEGLEKLVALHERMTANAARRQFSAAMAAFKAACPPIPKTATADIVSKSGARYKYNYAPLEQIDRVTAPILGRLGLSYRWDFEERDGKVVVTCTLEHENGFSVSSRFNCVNTSASGMTEQQKNSAAFTTAKRQSLQGVLGLTTCDPDNDGAEPVQCQCITEHQAANLEALIAEVNADKGRFLRFYSVERLEDLPASQFQSAVRALEAKRGGNK